MNRSTGAAEGTRQTGVRKIIIDNEQAGQRIDNFLRRQLPGVPKGRLYRIIRRGEVRVNSGRVRAEYKLEPGDVVRIPPARINAGPDTPPAGKIADLEGQVLFEDKRLLVINKPSGLAVHGGSGISHGVIELLRAARPDIRDLSLVHRLDRETSGCLVLAKRRSALRELHAKFRDGTVEKNYLALVVGDWQLGEQIVARGVDHPSAERVDQALDFAAMGPKREDRGLVVVVHQPAVADRIGAQNGRQPAIQGLRGHLQLPRELPSA